MWRSFGAIVAANLVARIFLALGLGFVTYVGLSAVLDQFSAALRSELTGLPADLVGLIGLTDLDIVINLVISAYSARLAISQLTKISVIGGGGS
jgi:hypothetical protein